MIASNEQRRSILCSQHERLRHTIEVTRKVAIDTLAGREAGDTLLAHVSVLRVELTAHLATEEELLLPILGNVDAWGPVRLELLSAEHAHQRAVLAILTGRNATPAAAPAVAGRVLAFCEDILEDMAFEERELFSADAMRDDCVMLDASDG